MTPSHGDGVFPRTTDPDAREAAPGTRRARSRRRAKKARRRPRVTFLGVVGELLITAGVLVGLFLGWQLGFNDLNASRAQADQGRTLSHKLLAEGKSGSPATGTTDDPPVTAAPEKSGTIWGVMYIPRFGTGYVKPLAQGTDRVSILNKIGIGHYPDSAMPGQVGNVAFAAHRVTYGRPFNQLGSLQAGDPVVIQTADGYYTYEFRNLKYVKPSQVDVVLPVPQKPDAPVGGRYLTLTSCNPMFSAAERIVAFLTYSSYSKTAPETIRGMAGS